MGKPILLTIAQESISPPTLERSSYFLLCLTESEEKSPQNRTLCKKKKKFQLEIHFKPQQQVQLWFCSLGNYFQQLLHLLYTESVINFSVPLVKCLYLHLSVTLISADVLAQFGGYCICTFLYVKQVFRKEFKKNTKA